MYNIYIYIYPKMKSDAGAYCLDPMGHVIDQALEHMDWFDQSQGFFSPS